MAEKSVTLESNSWEEVQAFAGQLWITPGDMKFAPTPDFAKTTLRFLQQEGMKLEELISRTGHPRFGADLLGEVSQMFILQRLSLEFLEAFYPLVTKMIHQGLWTPESVQQVLATHVGRLVDYHVFRRDWGHAWSILGKARRKGCGEVVLGSVAITLYQAMRAKGVLPMPSTQPLEHEQVLFKNLWMVGKTCLSPEDTSRDMVWEMLLYFHQRSSRRRRRQRDNQFEERHRLHHSMS